MDLSDVGTAAVIGGVVGEAAARLAKLLGRAWKTDAWREGMFVSGGAALLAWVFQKLGRVR